MSVLAKEEKPDARTTRLGLRATQRQQQLIHRAAEALNKSVTEFVLESACEAAENTLLDQRLFMLEDDDWQKFKAALDQPVKVKPGLQNLMKEKAPWE